MMRLIKKSKAEIQEKTQVKTQIKAQITMFVILGLVLLVIFIIILSLVKSLKPKPATVERVLSELETGKIKNHISNCIVDVAMDGLEKLGDNGGVIYDFEGGTIPFGELTPEQDYLNYTYFGKPYHVAYALKQNTVCKNVTYNIPDYPYVDAAQNPVPLSDLNKIYNNIDECLFASDYSAYDGFFGQNTMSRLCYIIRDSGCESFARGLATGLTLQRQLEDYIAKKLPLCVNLDSFSQDMKVDITVESNPVVQVNIHSSEILVLTKYPLKISFPNQEPVKKIIDYQNTLQVRLGRLYNFIYDIYSKDSKKADFDLDTDFIQSSFFIEGFQVARIKDPCVGCSLVHKYDDIIEVVDTKSFVKTRPFLFRTARENRGPAIDFIPELSVDAKRANFTNYPLAAYDPDDENVKYYFLALGFGNEQCGGPWVSSRSPCTATIQTGWCGANPDVKDMLLKRGLLRIPINMYDSGKHKVGILAVDDSGLFDYQTFNIIVSDSSATYPVEQYCVGNCTDYLSTTPDLCVPNIYTVPGKLKYCTDWCDASFNQCNNICLLNTNDPFKHDGPCRDCVLPIVYAQAGHNYITCVGLNKSSCLSRMNDCFWINISVPGGFREECVNVTSLEDLTPPAYIITS
jgi:hypothetical protein